MAMSKDTKFVALVIVGVILASLAFALFTELVGAVGTSKTVAATP